MTVITLQNFRSWVVAQPENTIFRPNSQYHCPFAEFLKFQNPDFLYCVDTNKPIDQFVTITLKLSKRSGNIVSGTLPVIDPVSNSIVTTITGGIFFLDIDPVFIELVSSIDQSPDIITVGQASDWNRHLPKESLLRIIDFYIQQEAAA